jgi:hypothetical protein
MEHETDLATAPDYSEVEKIVRELVRETINKLDSLTLQQVVNSQPADIPQNP